MIWLLLLTLGDLAEVECSVVCEALLNLQNCCYCPPFAYCYDYYSNTEQIVLNSIISWSPHMITMQIP